MNYQTIIEQLHALSPQYYGLGSQATYIPALSAINSRQCGIAVATLDGARYNTGDADVRFSTQSISKVFSLALVQRHMGNELWQSVGREPSGTPFNSLVQLEHEQGVPRNPFINSGALVIVDRMMSLYENADQQMIEFVRALSANDTIDYDMRIAQSELDTAYRNRALANFMRSFGNIKNDVDSVVEHYCKQCSIAMSCTELAEAFLFLANGGINPHTGETVLSPSRTKRMNALMLTCGLYDESGDFAFRVGMPGKSGIGGGIVAVIPQKLSIAVWSPELNSHGNSLLGVEILERFTTEIGVSIF